MLKTELKRENKVLIKEVETKNELRTFVNYPNVLYKDNPCFVPALYGDDLSDWDKNKNPAFEYCEARCFLAYKDGEVAGRIGAILSHAANKKWNTKRMRFTQVDFIDDLDVSAALFDAVESWAEEKECSQVHGPLGFSDLDREGMLVEGFDQKSMFITYYNAPYYNEHLEKLGYSKDVDWIEYKISTPEQEGEYTKKIHKIAERVLERKKLHIAKLKKRSEYQPYIEKVFNLVNEAYAELYGVVELNKRQVERYAKKFIPLIDPNFACFVMDEQDNMVGFGISAPSMAEALKKSGGKLFPFGWIGVLKALKSSSVLDLFLIAVKPELQGAGINAIILDYLIGNANKRGIKYSETGPQLEINTKILSQWKLFEKVQHKRRRCYIKNLTTDAVD